MFSCSISGSPSKGKTLVQRTEEQGQFPVPRQRWRTGELKSSPLAREFYRYIKDHARFEGRLISAMGMRRDESLARAKRVAWKRNDRMSVAGREVFDWLPLFDLTTEDMFGLIRDAGQSPLWINSHGVSRCSCSFCIFGSQSDLRRAPDLRPDVYRRYAELEVRIGHTLSPSRVPLTQFTGVPL